MVNVEHTCSVVGTTVERQANGPHRRMCVGCLERVDSTHTHILRKFGSGGGGGVVGGGGGMVAWWHGDMCGVCDVVDDVVAVAVGKCQ